jgi:hypothetical protein
MRIRILTAAAVAFSVSLMPAQPALAACAWSGSQLAVPGGYTRVVANGAAQNSAFIVGHAIRADGGNDGVVWNDGVPQVLPKPPVAGDGSNRADAVNNAGVIAGVWRGTNNLDVPWRYQNGVYQLLPLVAGTSWYVNLAISNPGDIIAQAYCLFCSPVGALWKAATPGQVTTLGNGVYAVGIDDTGRYVTNTKVIVSPNGPAITLQRDVWMRTFSRGRILAEDINTHTIVEWNVTGQLTREFPGVFGHVVTTAGLIVGQPPNSVYLKVRNGSAWEPMSPPLTGAEEITEGNVVVATYNHDNNPQTPLVGGVYRRSCG